MTMKRFELQFLGLPSPKLVYVETFARVRTLSLTGKLLRPIADRCELLLPPLHSVEIDLWCKIYCAVAGLITGWWAGRVSWVAGLSEHATLVLCSVVIFLQLRTRLRITLGASIDSIVVVVSPERTNGKAGSSRWRRFAAQLATTPSRSKLSRSVE